MKKTTTIIILSLSLVHFISYAQIFELPSFQNNHVSTITWKDTLFENQTVKQYFFT